MECYKCGKLGHRAAECRSNKTTSDRQQDSDKPPPKCFTCDVVGHKSLDCPTRITAKREQENKGKKDIKKTLHNNRVSLSEEDLVENDIRATVADLEFPLLLDSGAQISILPEEIVPTTAKTGETVVKGNGQGTESRG